jgi:CheY-like chemotaxis protein
MGFETRTTWSGYEALGLLASERSDVLLVDDYMPDLHLNDSRERVGRLPTQPWIVVMQAASPTQDQVRRYAMLGATNVVRKHHIAEVSKTVSSCWIDYSLAKIYVN